MKVIGSHLFVETEELAALGVPRASISTNMSQSRIGQRTAGSWVGIQHPADKRKVLVLYSSIPKRTVQRYSLPSEADMLARHKKQEVAAQELAAILAEHGR